jgi:ATP-dependent protease HslVU (ClpYQ) peptidase subunit
MTCIVGALSKNHVIIAGDSAGFGGNLKIYRSDPKVFKVEANLDYLLGHTTSYRMGQLLRYDFKPPSPTFADINDPLRFMVRQFIPALRTLLKTGGFSTIKENVEEGGVFLVGCSLGLFLVESDFQVAIAQAPFMAIGAGVEIALGAMAALGLDQRLTSVSSTEAKLRGTLSIVQRFCPFVAGNTTIAHLTLW